MSGTKSTTKPRRGTASALTWLRRYRFETAAALGLAALVAFLVLLVPSREETRQVAAPATLAAPASATSTAVPQQTGPTSVPVYAPPQKTGEIAIRLVASLPSHREVGRTLGDTLPGQWTAEYRGDGTWMVRNGESAWLYMEDSNAAMPANLAAINAQGASRGRAVR